MSRFFIIVICLSLVLNISACSYNRDEQTDSDQSNQTQNQTKEQHSQDIKKAQEVTLVLSFGDEEKEKVEYPYSISQETELNAFDLLVSVSEKEQIELNYYETDFGIVVTSIDSTVAKQDYYWFLYVNSESIEMSPDKKHVTGGDRVEFRFEKAL